MDAYNPSKLTSAFKIEVTGNLVTARIQGEWELSMAIQYFTELTQAIRTIQSHPWASLVDMRGWALGQSAKQSADKIKLELDRRNQLLEFWIVTPDEPNDSLARFPLQAGITLFRVQDTHQMLSKIKPYSLLPEKGWENFSIPSID